MSYETADQVRAAQFNPEIYRRNGGVGGGQRSPFCSVAHPGNPDPNDCHPEASFAFCRRFPHFDGTDHSAFVHSIAVPETWPDTRFD